MTMLQEYDLDINPTNMVKGKGLCLLETQSNNLEQEKQWIQEEDMYVETTDVLLFHH